MAVLPMKKIEICAMKRDRKAILEKLQSLGMVEIQTNNEETDDFRKMSTTSQRAKYEYRIQMKPYSFLISMFRWRNPYLPAWKDGRRRQRLTFRRS